MYKKRAFISAPLQLSYLGWLVGEVLPPTQHGYRLYRGGWNDEDGMIMITRKNRLEGLFLRYLTLAGSLWCDRPQSLTPPGLFYNG